MKRNDLYRKMKEENIYFIKHKLSFTRGMIARYNNLTVIIIDNTKVKSRISENTVLMQELGHYMANAYYKTNSHSKYIEQMERLADITAWEEFLPYEEVQSFMKKGYTKATDLAKCFGVEAPYMARCLNYYYKKYKFK